MPSLRYATKPFAAIKARFGFADLSQPVRTSMMAWLHLETFTTSRIMPSSFQGHVVMKSLVPLLFALTPLAVLIGACLTCP